METHAERFRHLLEVWGLTQEELGNLCGIKRGTVGTIVNGKTTPDANALAELLRRRPDLSPDWLLTGTGPMLRGGGRALAPAPPAAGRSTEAPLRVVEETAEIGYLKERLKDKETIIEILREQLDRLSTYLPEQLGKLVPDSYAAEPRARVGFTLANVQMLCNGRAYTDARHEARSIWHQESTMKAA